MTDICKADTIGVIWMNNLIDRQAAIDFIDAGHLCNPNELRWSDNDVVNFLKKRPSAEPERKTGQWIKDESGDYKCSECGGREDQFIYGREIWYGNGESNFCPNCGVRMVGEQ